MRCSSRFVWVCCVGALLAAKSGALLCLLSSPPPSATRLLSKAEAAVLFGGDGTCDDGKYCDVDFACHVMNGTSTERECSYYTEEYCGTETPTWYDSRDGCTGSDPGRYCEASGGQSVCYRKRTCKWDDTGNGECKQKSESTNEGYDKCESKIGKCDDGDPGGGGPGGGG